MSWRDPTRDAIALAEVPNTPPETRFRKVQTEADDRFFDAAAVMFPSRPGSGAIAPSLQMGDAEHPVEIYYWNATRGTILMQAPGRGTTRRTGQNFPANSTYLNGQWNVIFELPDLRAGTTVAFAVWNGSQKDRDGRKYFSTWADDRATGSDCPAAGFAPACAQISGERSNTPEAMIRR